MSSTDSNIAAKMANLGRQLAGRVDQEFATLVNAKEHLREELVASGDILRYESTVPDLPKSMCAVDGARIREQVYAVDLLYACAAAADARFVTEKPKVEPLVWADAFRHMDGTEALVQTAMGALEVTVASRAPHEVVALDGSFVTPIIALQSALFAKQPEVRDAAADLLLDEDLSPLKAFRALLEKPAGALLALTKSDSARAYADKYAERFGIRLGVSDRVLAATVLQPGEMLAPRRMFELAGQSLNEVKGSAKVRRAADELAALISLTASRATAGNARTTYFKPHGAHTVIRFEYFTPEGTDAQTGNETAMRFAAIINADTRAPHLLEPFCQYAVDAEVKTISTGARALKQSMMANLPADRAAAYRTLLAENYRTK